MPGFLNDLLPTLSLIALGAFLGRRNVLSETTVEGFRTLISKVTLPAVMFAAFSRMEPGAGHLALAAAVFAACALLGLAGGAIGKALRLPMPSTAFLFQGYEAGMLGYSLFGAFFGSHNLTAFAGADLGQVVYVFTVLFTLLASGEGRTGASRADFRAIAVRILSSPVMIAIIAGLLSALFIPGARGLPWGEGGFLESTLAAVGGITGPLVCLVVGFGLREGVAGAASAAVTVALRMLLSAGAGSLIAFVLVPALGFGRIQSLAVMVLFVLPPPFVIPVFRKAPDESGYVSAALSLHTLLSLAATAAIAAFSAAATGGAP